jgi:hypothetical protein
MWCLRFTCMIENVFQCTKDCELTMQAMIGTWLLQPEINTAKVDSILALVRDEISSE